MLHQNTCPAADIPKTLHAEELFGRAYLASCAWTVEIRGVPTGNPGETDYRNVGICPRGFQKATFREADFT